MFDTEKNTLLYKEPVMMTNDVSKCMIFLTWGMEIILLIYM